MRPGVGRSARLRCGRGAREVRDGAMDGVGVGELSGCMAGVGELAMWLTRVCGG